jgi:hypothetical protein
MAGVHYGSTPIPAAGGALTTGTRILVLDVVVFVTSTDAPSFARKGCQVGESLSGW